MSVFGFWLLPSADQLNAYNLVIQELAKKYDAPLFDAHITILNPIKAQLADLTPRVAEVAARNRKMNLEFMGVNFSSTYYQSVYGQVRMSPELLDLHLDLRSSLEYKEPYHYVPHMSLIYADLDSKGKLAIANSQSLLSDFEVSTIAIVTGDSPSPSDWEIVARYDLAD